ncbi:MAG TPA: GH116 family glycosyl hydrolase [Gemmatimonadales bacterium]|nr:GH116 family glycosyl hydrolase [Gemmatimonadales bacterium]
MITGYAAVVVSGAPALRAQDSLRVPRFEISDSPVQLTGDVRPQQYLGVIGRRAAWLGTETGAAELWVHPIKLVSDFQLAFRIPDYDTPVRGADVARTVTVRPEITTITYSHATFTVRQHILAPMDAPGLLVLLEVDTFQPLTIVGSFRTVFQFAWPAAFGGQYSLWSPDDGAFILSESLRKRNAVIGSPWIASGTSHPAHALPDAPSEFTIPIDSARAARARSEFIPIGIVAGIAPRDSVLGWYRELISSAERAYGRKREYVRDLLGQATHLDTPDDELDLAFAWSLVNLDEQLTCNPDLGCGLVAGWGPSGKGQRPGFGWFFGGDAAINSLAMDATGLWSQVAQGLRFLARYQREDGKIPHEISQAAAHIPWFTDFPYTYYHADTTPYWILALWRYWRASGDTTLLRELWPSARKAYAWGLTQDKDGDGLIENGPGNLGAIEVGALGEGLHEDIYLAAIGIEAVAAMREMATARGETGLARDAARHHEVALRTLNTRYWRDREGHHAFAILQSGRTNDNLTVWPATAMTFAQLEPEQARRTLVKLAADSISSDWGGHPLSTGSPLYDPMHYNNGAVWPFVTGFLTLAQYRYGRPWAGYPLISALAQMTFDWGRGRHPEVLSGTYYRPLDTAVPQQFFATSMLVSPVMMGLLGWEPDAPNNRATLAPQLPPEWPLTRVHRLRVGDASMDAMFLRMPGSLTAQLWATRGRPALTLDLPIPLGATDVKLQVDSAAAPLQWAETPAGRRLRVGVPPGGRHTVTVEWAGGLELSVMPEPLEPGQTSHGIRVLDLIRTREGFEALLEGERSRAYHLRLHGVRPLTARATGAAAEIQPTAMFHDILRITFPEGTGRATARVRLVP